MNTTYAICYVALLVLGVFFARRWLIAPPAAICRFPRALRVAALIFGGWAGSFATSNLASRIEGWIGGGIAYDGDAEIPYEMLYDGVGNNVWNLFFGWMVGCIAWGMAAALFKQRTEPACDNKTDPVSS